MARSGCHQQSQCFGQCHCGKPIPGAWNACSTVGQLPGPYFPHTPEVLQKLTLFLLLF